MIFFFLLGQKKRAIRKKKREEKKEGLSEMTFIFQVTDKGNMLVPQEVFRNVGPRCAFVKCYVAFPKQKFQFSNTFCLFDLLNLTWIELQFQIEELQHTNIFIKLKLLDSNKEVYDEQLVQGSMDITQATIFLTQSLAQSSVLLQLLSNKRKKRINVSQRQQQCV